VWVRAGRKGIQGRNYAESVLKDAQIVCFVLDTHVSILDGSIGAIPRRLTVIDEDYDDACKALQDAGLGDEIFTAG